MASAIVIGTNTWPVRISDDATDAADSRTWYMKGLVKEVWDMTPITTFETGDDQSFAYMFGQFRWTATIDDVVVKTKADMDKIKQTMRKWNDENDLLYFQNKLGSTDEGTWSDDDYDATASIRCRVHRVVWKKLSEDARVCTVYVKRYTT